MSSIAISTIVFACVFGGALFGMFLRAVLPQQHLNSDSKDVVKLGMGIVATLSALVPGLLIASAKGSYDAQSAAITQMSAKVILLDRVLAHYGPETKETRDGGVIQQNNDSATQVPQQLPQKNADLLLTDAVKEE